jgi:hypothetical protein
MRLGLALLLASFAPAALADDLPKTATGDIDGDGSADTVELRRGTAEGQSVDVAVFLSKGRRIVNVWDLVGAETVEPPVIGASGEVHLSFGWLSGRYKTSTEFFIGLQDGHLVVRRFKRAVADGIAASGDATKVQSCDVDFVADRAMRNDKDVAASGKPIALAAWRRDESVPPDCRF